MLSKPGSVRCTLGGNVDMKLRKKLIIIFILISIIPFLAGMGIILLQSGSAFRRNPKGFLSKYSAIAAGDIETFFEREGENRENIEVLVREVSKFKAG
jgi:hypothetical protein